MKFKEFGNLKLWTLRNLKFEEHVNNMYIILIIKF